MPTYKRSIEENFYINKKNQAPSYCDRILYKNNVQSENQVLYYDCQEGVLGSDHRPVLLSLVIP